MVRDILQKKSQTYQGAQILSDLETEATVNRVKLRLLKHHISLA